MAKGSTDISFPVFPALSAFLDGNFAHSSGDIVADFGHVPPEDPDGGSVCVQAIKLPSSSADNDKHNISADDKTSPVACRLSSSVVEDMVFLLE